MATITSEDLEEDILKHRIDAFIEKPLSIASIDQILDDIAREKSNRKQTNGDTE